MGSITSKETTYLLPLAGNVIPHYMKQNINYEFASNNSPTIRNIIFVTKSFLTDSPSIARVVDGKKKVAKCLYLTLLDNRLAYETPIWTGRLLSDYNKPLKAYLVTSGDIYCHHEE